MTRTSEPLRTQGLALTDPTVFDGATIAFDLDGTLVDSGPDLIAAVNAVLVEDGIEPFPYDLGRKHISRGARWLLRWGLQRTDVCDPDARAHALFGSFIDYYTAHVADKSRPFPGAVDALTCLKAAGAKLVVCTNKPTDLSRSLLTKLDMAHCVDGIVGADAVSAMKPEAAHLIEAVAAVRGDLSRTVMVGDAQPDAHCARAAGVPLILVTFGYTDIPAADLAPDVLLHRFDDLVAVCERLLYRTP